MHRPVRQNAFAAALPIRAGRVDDLRATLQLVREDDGGIEANPYLPFAELTTVHFARFAVVDTSLTVDAELRTLEPALLFFSSNYDGPLDRHLAELAEVGGAWLHDVFAHCAGYDAAAAGARAIAGFFKRHAVPYAAFHVGAVGLSVQQIRDEEALRLEIQSFLDDRVNLRCETDPLVIRREIRAHLESRPDLRWATAPLPRAGFFETLPRGSVGRFFAALARVLAGVVITIATVGIPVWAFRRKERSDPVFPRTRYDERAQRLAAREDKIVQNQMTALVDLKPGWLRGFVLRTVLVSINTLARLLYSKGRLGGIPTIHFARWVLLREERALLFLSNYTGSWEQYLGDFIDRASVGLTAVWSNTVLYPRTRWLLCEGARDEERFKTWARAQQIETDLWYSAYRDLSMPNILNNHAIRRGLVGEPTRDEALAWIRRL